MHTVRNRRASAPPAAKSMPKPVSTKAQPAFPADIAITPHRGAVPTTSPDARPAPKLSKPEGKAKRPKRAAKAKAPAVAAKAQRAKNAAAAPPVIALPPRAEPLVAEPNPAPLPRNRAPVLLRKGGLPGLIAQWLSLRARRLQHLLTPAPKRPAPRRPADEMARLRAENERLKLQIEALLVLQAASAPAQPAVPG